LSAASRTYEREMKQKNEELNQLRVELELSKKRLDDKDKLEREFFNKHQVNSSKHRSNIRNSNRIIKYFF